MKSHFSPVVNRYFQPVMNPRELTLSLTFIPYCLSTKDLRFDALRVRSMLSGLIIPADLEGEMSVFQSIGLLIRPTSSRRNLISQLALYSMALYVM